MATLFGDLPTAGIRGGSSRGGSAAGGALVATGTPIGGERALQWVYDEETSNCMHCNTPFTLLTRKHHCRRCGHVICHNCSPHKRRITVSDPFPMRVCNTCYAAVDEHFASLEWSGHSASEVAHDVHASKADPVLEGRVHIGQLYVKVVEAIGLPSTDSITSDPFVRVTLTGKWSHGQAWGSDLQSVKCTKKKSRTLNPRWHETFVFNVCAPGAELLFEVYNYGQLSQPTKLGEATIALSALMDQRRHNKWLDLLLPEKLHRAGLNNDARAGRMHVLLHYKFSRTAEFCSYYAAEQPFVVEWPEFTAAQLYSNFWVLLDTLWPYLEVVWHIVPTLNWDFPTHSCLCFCLCVWLCLSLQWVPVVLHLALIAFVLRNYFALNIHSFADAKDAAAQHPTQQHATTTHATGAHGATSSSTHSTNNVTFDSAGAASESTTTNSNSSQFRQYALPAGFHHVMNKMTHVTIDHETKLTLQSVQNTMAWWSSVITNVELMFSWEDTFYTARILLYLILSCVLHILIPNKYLLLAVVVFLFVQWTVPFLWLTHLVQAIRRSIQSLVHQHRVTRRSEQNDLRASREAMRAASVPAMAFATGSASTNAPLLSAAALASAVAASDKLYPRLRRSTSNASARAHMSVSKKEEMFGAAASAISQRFAVNGGSSSSSSSDRRRTKHER